MYIFGCIAVHIFGFNGLHIFGCIGLHIFGCIAVHIFGHRCCAAPIWEHCNAHIWLQTLCSACFCFKAASGEYLVCGESAFNWMRPVGVW